MRIIIFMLLATGATAGSFLDNCEQTSLSLQGSTLSALCTSDNKTATIDLNDCVYNSDSYLTCGRQTAYTDTCWGCWLPDDGTLRCQCLDTAHNQVWSQSVPLDSCLIYVNGGLAC
ncbi:hypothetical protein EXIGLDRAFT_750807 [Exidia glandulosa HHB12029]|uniref:Cyanovirin-N domain-containing protein n=1 Tax=Exidia glandulosa HHB12029 TaxID=1314781 RepID=A0A165G7I4_EXIGL|nr:hypothetical protein EXIGLDRAFT_750807 [Exidia glandulosa HHB12029]